MPHGSWFGWFGNCHYRFSDEIENMTRNETWKDTVAKVVDDGTFISLALACLVISSWLAIHITSIFFIDWSTNRLWLIAPFVVAFQTWLSVGLFIVAHDSMHGSLAPHRPKINRLIGALCVALYAGFSYSKLFGNHHAHHRNVGTADDPDFDVDHQSSFWPWYTKFMVHYFGGREFLTLTFVVAIYWLILGSRFPALLVFWALPAILSSLQLFYFGTYRPHRVDDVAFKDNHRARSENFSWTLSLLTCFHFGYHHEHHDRPWVPWWKLPSMRKLYETAESV
jgi:beta-carotene/zeaxanthin 4-ketolase